MRDWLGLFPNLPERTLLFRLFKTHQAWTDRFLVDTTVLGVADTYGIELLHPYREGRSDKQIGLITGWDCDTANVYDATFHPLLRVFEDRMIILADHGFFSKQGNPENMKVCKCGT